jgi:hypothetical protein
VAPTCFWDWTNKVRLGDTHVLFEIDVHRIISYKTNQIIQSLVVGLINLSSILVGLSLP